MSYATEIQAVIDADASRSQWGPAEWRAYFLTSESGTVDVTISASMLAERLGLVRTQEILTTIKAANEYAHDLLIAGNYDTGTKDAIQILRSPLTSQERTALNKWLTKNAPRHELLRLPDPRERLMKKALEEINE